AGWHRMAPGSHAAGAGAVGDLHQQPGGQRKRRSCDRRPQRLCEDGAGLAKMRGAARKAAGLGGGGFWRGG
ncbi:unnamed protein product, partial [Effrenium voratum]